MADDKFRASALHTFKLFNILQGAKVDYSSDLTRETLKLSSSGERVRRGERAPE